MTVHLRAAAEKVLCSQPDDWGDDKLHVSDLAVSLKGDDGKCPRQLWLRLNGAEKQETTFGQRLMFEAGHRLHAAAADWLWKGLGDGWYVSAVELPLDADGISGTCDCVLTGPQQQKVVVDFKTVRGRAMQYLESPKPANVLQVQTYSYALCADYGKLWYLDREGQNGTREFVVDRDDAAVKAAIGVAKRIEGMSEPPPVLEPVEKKKGLDNPWQCTYCPYLGVSCPGALAAKENAA